MGGLSDLLDVLKQVRHNGRTMNITKARKEFYSIANQVNESHEEVTVLNSATGNNIVIISEDDWNAIKETLFLNSIPGMAESIIAASTEPLDEASKYQEDEAW